MKYDFTTLKISKQIIGGKDVLGTTIDVDVYVQSYDNTPLLYANSKVSTSGVNTSIVGKLMTSSPLLFIGKNKLTYLLTGKAISGTYIQFDFTDINNIVQSYGFQQVIL